MTNVRGELVPDSLRAETLAEYFEQVQCQTSDTEEYKQANIDTEPIFEDCPDTNTGHIAVEESNHAIHRVNNKKTPGPDGLPSELYKWLNKDNRKALLQHLKECWESESLEDSMNDAVIATIYKKGRTDRPENYRPIALFNVTYKPLAIIYMFDFMKPSTVAFPRPNSALGKTKAQPSRFLAVFYLPTDPRIPRRIWLKLSHTTYYWTGKKLSIKPIKNE